MRPDIPDYLFTSGSPLLGPRAGASAFTEEEHKNIHDPSGWNRGLEWVGDVYGAKNCIYCRDQVVEYYLHSLDEGTRSADARNWLWKIAGEDWNGRDLRNRRR